MTNKQFQVFVDDNFHYMDEGYRYKAGEYDTLEEAIDICKSITESSMNDAYRPGINAKDLIESYRCFGEDPWIWTGKPGVCFSAWTYVENEAQDFINRKKQYDINSKNSKSN